MFNGRAARFKKCLERIWSECFSWSLALCSDWTGSTGLPNRASLLGFWIFSDKWTVLIEFPFTFGVVDQAVSANAVPSHVIAIQETQAIALQWLLLAVTAVDNNNNRKGWSGSVFGIINTHTLQHIRQMFRGNTCGQRSRPWHKSTHKKISHIIKSYTHAYTNTSLYTTYRPLNAWML